MNEGLQLWKVDLNNIWLQLKKYYLLTPDMYVQDSIYIHLAMFFGVD